MSDKIKFLQGNNSDLTTTDPIVNGVIYFAKNPDNDDNYYTIKLDADNKRRKLYADKAKDSINAINLIGSEKNYTAESIASEFDGVTAKIQAIESSIPSISASNPLNITTSGNEVSLGLSYGDGLTLNSANKLINSGVRSITTGADSGTFSVNTNGISSNQKVGGWDTLVSTVNSKANKADIAATASLGQSNSSIAYVKISNFGNWGSGAWNEKGFSMLVTSRAGETVWVSVSSDDSNTNAKAIRLLNTYSKINKLYYSVAESAIYVQANPWCNNINAHILSNINGDYVPTVVQASALASDAVEIEITELGPTGSALNLGNNAKALTLLGNATRPTYNGNDLALSSDLGSYVKLNGTSTMVGPLHIQVSNPYVHFRDTGYSTDWYVQAYQDYFYIGPTSSSAVRVDKNGNLMSPGTVKVGNAVTLQYNSTDKSLDFIF